MPNQILAGESSLLTFEGWRKVRNTPANGPALGIDRGGRFDKRAVQVDRLDAGTNVVYLGSDAAFGAFHPDSSIIDSDNRSHSADSIVRSGLVGELRFENAVFVEDCKPDVSAIEDLWTDLLFLSVLSDEDKLVLPAKGWDEDDPASEDGVERAKGCVGPLLIDRKDFFSSLQEEWRTEVPDLVADIFEHTAEDDIVFDRESYVWCLWSLMAFPGSAERKYRLTYDNLQHSTMVQLRMDAPIPTSGLSKGGTAFVKKDEDLSFQLSWNDSSWSPVSSGFLLAPD